MKFIGYYTKNTPYEQEADELIKTLNKYGIDYHIYEVENKGSWVENCAQKSTIVKQAILDFNQDIFYIDVDARVLREPPLDQLHNDKPMLATWNGPRKRFFEVLSGSMYFPNEEISLTILRDWENLQKSKRNVWDQKVLQLVLNKYEYDPLPLEWCWIKEFMQDIKDPIIWHTQASRRLRRVIK